MPLYYLSIAYNGETWYEKHFGAVQQNVDKQIAYKERVNKILYNQSEKPTNYLRFYEIASVPSSINNEIKYYYEKTTTYSEFFHSIPKSDRCRLLRPWIKEFMEYYFKRVFSNFDWKINLANITGGSKRKTRKNNAKYYCPKGIIKNGFAHTNIGCDI